MASEQRPTADRSRVRVFQRKTYPNIHLRPGHHDKKKEPKQEDTIQPQIERNISNEKDEGIQQDNAMEQGNAISALEGGSSNRKGSVYNHNGHRVSRFIQPDGESGRRGFSPWKFLSLCFKSTCTASMVTNILWPFTLAAMILHFRYPEHELWIFITAYIGMVPAANLIGYAGQELARKLPTVLGVVLETTFGSVVEIVLFMVLIRSPGEDRIPVIRAAILGSILANLLLCLGLCFLVGGIFHPQQTFHEAISEVGSNLMFVACVGLVIPTIYYNSLAGNNGNDNDTIAAQSLNISRATAIVLLVAFVVYMYFQIRSHHGLYEDILHGDEEQDVDRWMDLKKEKLTFTEACLAVAIGVTFVSFMAVFLVQQIEVSLDSMPPRSS